MADNKINVGGRLHSIATGNVLAGANEILDDSKNKKQNVINAEVDIALADRYTKEETYNKNELDSLITTPDAQYVTVTATEQTTVVTDVLPATGAANTIYRVGNWDGTQYKDSVFSEYAWTGSVYIKLSTKSQIGEVYDISANHDGTKYVDLTAALGNDGVNIPQSLRKGGMSVKFVRTSDNKYVQYFCKSQSFSTDPEDWAIADDGVYVENPEWIKVLTDKNGKILYAIKPDGTVNWHIEIPDKIKNYIDTLVPVSVDSEIDSEEFVHFVRSNQNVLLSIDKYGECFVTKLRTKTIESETTNDIINNVKNNTAAITSSLETAKNYTDAQVSAEATQRNNQITDVDNALRTLINEAETEVQDGEITVSKLAQDVLDLINSSGGGTITNAADEEDLTTVDNRLKFKDRPAAGTSLGYTILRSSFIVSDDVTLDANKIYKIRYSINLNQHTLTVPSGTILDFDGGYLYNGTINGNGGCIKASGYKIFGNITIAGQFANKFRIEWFGAIPSGTVDSSTAINAAINSGALELCGDGNLYYLASPVNLNKRYLKLEFLGNVKVARDCNGFVISKSDVDLKIKRLYAANTPTGGDSSLSSGLLLTGNCYNSTININHISSFGRGINLCPDVNQTEADYSGIQYCKFYFQYINCLECIVFDVRDNSSIWINENSFFGGRLTGGIGIKQYGTRTACLDGNKFEFVAFEGLTSMIMDGIYGWSNCKFIHSRMSAGENTASSPYIVMSNSENINIEIEGELNAATYIDCTERNNSNILIKSGAKYNYYQQNSVKNLTLEEIFNSLTE